VARLHGPLRSALRHAGVEATRLAEVVLVGGATRMPCVQRAVTEALGRTPLHHGDPDLLVAEGAAIQAAMIDRSSALEDLVVTDVASHSLGVDTTREVGGRFVAGYFSPIIHRNTVVPTTRWGIYNTLYDDQTEILFRVYEGEARRAGDNRRIGEIRVGPIPKARAGWPVQVRFTYDHNGMLEVEGRVSSARASPRARRCRRSSTGPARS
jgi:molecular chaperone HscC